MSNYIKARIDKTQQNSKCSLCGDRDETINHIISECSKLAPQEYKTRHDWVGNVIHWEICNILTSDPAELSNKKCTRVNNRCIRSKISGDNLDCDGLN